MWGRDRELGRLAAAVNSGRSIVVTGPLGIGKSRLLSRFIEERTSDRWVVHVVANHAASTIPFGAVATLLPVIEAADQLALLRAAVDRFVRLSDGRLPVVIIDDAHHLDTASTALLYEICLSRDVPLIATFRHGESLPVAVAELFKEVGAERMELAPLSRDDIFHLAAQILKSDPGDTLLDELAARSEGNPLFIVELLRAYQAKAPDGLTGRLSDLVRARLDALSTEAQAVMEYVAIGEPILVALDLIGDEALVELERAGLVAIEEREDGVVVARGAHPLYGEVVRAGMGGAARRLAAYRLSTSMLAAGRRTRGDALRLAGWLLDMGDEPDPQLAVEAAREALAWLETEFARRLIDLALSREVTYRAAFVSGEVCRVTGDVEGAKKWFNQALELAADDAEIHEGSLSLAYLHAFFDSDPATSVVVLERAIERMSMPAKRLELGVDRTLFWSLLGKYDDVMAAAREAIGDPACDARTEWTALLHSLWAETQTMNLVESAAHIQRALRHTSNSTVALPGTIDLLHALDVGILAQQGRLREGLDRGCVWLESAPDRGVPSGTMYFSIASVHWSVGNLVDARAAADRSIEQLSAFDWFNTMPLAIAQATILAIADGDARGAQRLLERGEQVGFGATPYGAIWRLRTEGWMFGADDPARAVTSLVESARRAFELTQLAWGLMALHDALTFDGASAAAVALDGLPRQPVDAAFMELVVRHIRARADGDRSQIVDCAETFESMEANWHAAGAWQAASRLSTDEIDSARAATRGVMLGLPAALGPHAADVVRSSLSPRQIEIARLAATGATSRAIASQMYLSIRTVDNHLRNIYRALGVDGRAALTQVLGGEDVNGRATEARRRSR